MDNVWQPYKMATNQLYKSAKILNIIFLDWALFFNAPVVSVQDVFICIFWHNLFARWSSLAADAQLAASSFERDSPPSPPCLLDWVSRLGCFEGGGRAGKRALIGRIGKLLLFKVFFRPPHSHSRFLSLLGEFFLSSPRTYARFGESWAKFSDIPCQLWNATRP